MRRGDLAAVALQGDQGKPRPALIVQSDLFNGLAAVTVLPLSGTFLDSPLLRIAVEPSPQNGLVRRSQIMIDKPQTPPRSKIGPVMGRLDAATLLTVDRALAVYMGLA